MRSIELTLDEGTDAAIRSDWATLSNAGLRSLAQHVGQSNRPHITLSAGETLEETADLRPSVSVLPLPISFGGMVVFRAGRRGFVLARLVSASSGLLALHSRVHSAAPGGVELTRPDHWTAHVTLARRLAAEEIAQALDLLSDVSSGDATGARLWDGSTKTLTTLV